MVIVAIHQLAIGDSILIVPGCQEILPCEVAHLGVLHANHAISATGDNASRLSGSGFVHLVERKNMGR